MVDSVIPASRQSTRTPSASSTKAASASSFSSRFRSATCSPDLSHRLRTPFSCPPSAGLAAHGGGQAFFFSENLHPPAPFHQSVVSVAKTARAPGPATAPAFSSRRAFKKTLSTLENSLSTLEKTILTLEKTVSTSVKTVLTLDFHRTFSRKPAAHSGPPASLLHDGSRLGRASTPPRTPHLFPNKKSGATPRVPSKGYRSDFFPIRKRSAFILRQRPAGMPACRCVQPVPCRAYTVRSGCLPPRHRLQSYRGPILLPPLARR